MGSTKSNNLSRQVSRHQNFGMNLESGDKNLDKCHEKKSMNSFSLPAILAFTFTNLFFWFKHINSNISIQLS